MIYKVTTKTQNTMVHVYEWIRRTESNPSAVIYKEDWPNKVVWLKDPQEATLDNIRWIRATVVQEPPPEEPAGDTIN